MCCPCYYCCELKIACILISIFEMVLSVALFVIGLLQLFSDSTVDLVVSTVVALVGLISAFILLAAAVRQSIPLCITWVTIVLIGVVLGIVKLVWQWAAELDIILAWGQIVSVIVTWYFACVVCSYIQELYVEREKRKEPNRTNYGLITVVPLN